jgi:mono/diheme cytochrome c family protein
MNQGFWSRLHGGAPHFPIKIKVSLLGILSGLAAVGLAFAAGGLIRPNATATPAITDGSVVPSVGTEAYRGYKLFLMNCAHCHGNDARGDEGPDLHGVTKSDARISALIKNGVPGEMPKFGGKLNDSDVQALIAFVRSLKNEKT